MTMRESEARQQVLTRLRVSRQLLTLAKVFLAYPDRPRDFSPDQLALEFARQQGYEGVEHVVLHPSVDLDRQLKQAAGRLSCELAFGQALRELIHGGHYMAYSVQRVVEPHQAWTTVVPGSGGTRSSWSFSELKHVLPERVMRSPYFEVLVNEPFTDPDLFAVDAGVEGADQEVVEALRDAALCLRNELFRPAVAQLGKAMEGAWIELGLALAKTLPTDHLVRSNKEGQMTNEDRSIAKKISDVRNLYSRRDLVGSVIAKAGIRPEELDSAVVWSDVVREARNAIHFGVKPAVANTYEKVVVLFLDGAKSLAMIYKIKRAADSLAAV